MGTFLMPSLGADMERGTVIEWRVAPGDVVHRGDIVALVDTEKADIEVEVFEDGRVGELLVPPGQQVPVGTPLAVIEALGATPAAGARVVAPEPEPAPPAASPAPAPVRQGPRTPLPAPAAGRRVRSSPYARRLAGEGGLDLGSLAGSGPGGAVVARDLVRAPATRPEGDRGATAPSRRANVAALMARSKREVPHYYLATTVDLGPALTWLAARNETTPASRRLLPAAVLLAAVARAATEVPTMNGHCVEDGFRPSAAVDLGIAIAVRDQGLVAPVIPDAARLSVTELMERLRAVTARARRGSFRASDLAPPSITVTNLGDQGADAVLGVIYPPQVALVGAGRIADRVVARDGRAVVTPTMTLTLAADHRASDGHEGSRFLTAIAVGLADPGALDVAADGQPPPDCTRRQAR
jgi:pyruvate dehydrogenase E2 component (dihydrolipoamide acetyltransferase)